MKTAILMTLAVLCMVATLPALYIGATLMQATGTGIVFPIPAALCLIAGGCLFHSAERSL